MSGALDLRTGKPDALERFFLRLAAEQLDHQTNPLYEVSRSSALCASSPGGSVEVMTPGWDQRLFGCSLDEYLALGLFLLYSHKFNKGKFDEAFFRHPDLLGILGTLTPSRAGAIYRRHFVQDVAQFRESVRPNDRPAPYRRMTFNPLVSKPALSGIGQTDLIPVPSLLSRKLSPLGLYHIGVHARGDAFARDFGLFLESYVGRNLQLCQNVDVHGEITYGPKKERKRSVDWFVVADNVVVLVEVKSVRPTEPVRTGGQNAGAELQRMLRKAIDQIERSDTEIAQRRQEFVHIPNDRPRVGLVVTLEDFHVVNADLIRSFAKLESPVPLVISSVGELESAVVGAGDFGKFVFDVATAAPATGNSLRGFFERLHLCENPLITQQWDALPVHTFVDRIVEA